MEKSKGRRNIRIVIEKAIKRFIGLKRTNENNETKFRA